MKTIETRLLPATQHRPARITAKVADGPLHWKLTRSYDHQGIDNAHADAAQALAARIGWTETMIGGHTKRGMVWVLDAEFSPRINRPNMGQKGTAA